LKRGLPKSILVNKEKVMKYKHVVISRKGGPGVLQVVEGELAIQQQPTFAIMHALCERIMEANLLPAEAKGEEIL